MRLPSWLRRAPPPPATPQPAALSTADLIATWERIIIGDAKHWVLFRHGTCVVLVGSPSGLSERALEILREWGPAHVGTPAADFNILTLLRPTTSPLGCMGGANAMKTRRIWKWFMCMWPKTLSNKRIDQPSAYVFEGSR
jgi:hypothetical protein